MAEFTEELNVEEKAHNPSDWVKYRRLIESLRKKLRARFSHDCPVLPSQEDPPTRWFHIILQTNNSGRSITLRIRLDNLYLDGYQVESKWFEFGRNDSEHLIPGSTFLGFGGGYNDLQNVARQMMERINVGQRQLTDAVIDLYTTTSSKERARALIIVIQMICEAIRYKRISNYLATTFLCDSPPPRWMMDLEHGWGALSAALLRADADPVHGFQFPQANNNLQIRTAWEAVDVLGILLDVDYGRLISARVPRMVNVQLSRGLSRVEVFSVCIDNIDGEDKGQLYGTITVIDGLGCQYIYNRRSEDFEIIYPKNDALLTGPNGRTISACDSFTINVDLKDYDIFSPDDEVSKGQISWNVFNITNKYDKLFSEVIKGKYGSATVNYIVFSNAVEVFVEVTFIDGDGENPANVYGDITARIKCFENKIMLFKKKEDEYIDVHPGGFIPLLRSKAAVPLYSSLIICAKLYDQDTISSDDEIANGNVEFPAQLYGTLEKYITGKYGKIQVKVTWINI